MKQIKQELVDDLPICEDGKEKITNLLKGMGYEIEKPVPRLKPGQVWNNCADIPCLICTEKKVLWLNTITGSFSSNNWEEHRFESKGTWLANSLEEYYAKKAKGEL